MEDIKKFIGRKICIPNKQYVFTIGAYNDDTVWLIALDRYKYPYHLETSKFKEINVLPNTIILNNSDEYIPFSRFYVSTGFYILTKYVPNTILFRKLYPNHTVISSNIIEVDL